MQNINKSIALTLKTLRRERGWSLDKASEETSVSKAMPHGYRNIAAKNSSFHNIIHYPRQPS